MRLSAFLAAALFSLVCHASPVTGTYVATKELPSRAAVIYKVPLLAHEKTLVTVSSSRTFGNQLLCSVYRGGDLLEQVVTGNRLNPTMCRIEFEPPAQGDYVLVVTNQADAVDTVHVIVQ